MLLETELPFSVMDCCANPLSLGVLFVTATKITHPN